MNIIKKLLLLGSIISSLFSDIIPGLTAVFVFMYLIIASIYVLKNKTKIYVNNYYIIIIINIIIILITSMINFSGTNIKFIMYLIATIFIMETTDDSDFKLVLNTIMIASIISSIYVIVVGKNFDTSNLDFINVRSQLIIQKQSYNALMNIVLPYTMIKLMRNREKKYIIPFILNIISGVFIFQIKTLFITLPLAYFIMLSFSKRIRMIECGKYVVVVIIGVLIIYKFNIMPQLTPIIDYLLHGNNSIYIGNKYLDTLLLRKEILAHCLSLLKSNIFWGIGYGNYGIYSSSKLYYVASKGIYVDFPSVTESGFLSFIVEGGIMGFIFINILFINILKDIKKVLKKSVCSIDESIIVIFLCLVISNIIQDNLNFTFWFFLGITMSLIKNKRMDEYESANN